MLTVELLVVGKIKEGYLQDAIDEYAKRLSRFCTLKITQVPDAGDDGLSLTKEAALLLPKCKGTCVPLCVEGKQLTSEELAQFIQTTGVEGSSHLCFIIGGSRGLAEEVKATGRLKLSFSKLTFPHQLMRVMMLEQLYRAFKIINGEQYHK